ncbi:MAG TPA: CapA family protein, partial [Chthonomonadaceae bacterium]|nr:CapA family protein [Chthonomonadaceae bacterium]
DLVIGHHPHVLQGVEIARTGARRALIAYSLGNFLFDGHKDAEKQSAILECRFGRAGLVSATVVPVQIDHSAPRPARGPERAAILFRLDALSRPLGVSAPGGAIRPVTIGNR